MPNLKTVVTVAAIAAVTFLALEKFRDAAQGAKAAPSLRAA